MLTKQHKGYKYHMFESPLQHSTSLNNMETPTGEDDRGEPINHLALNNSILDGEREKISAEDSTLREF